MSIWRRFDPERMLINPGIIETSPTRSLEMVQLDVFVNKAFQISSCKISDVKVGGEVASHTTFVPRDHVVKLQSLLASSHCYENGKG